MNVRIKADENVLDQVVRHRPRCGDLFDFERDGVSFVNPNPDGQHYVTGDVLQDDDGHVGDRVHHQSTNFHFYFHVAPLQTAWRHRVKPDSLYAPVAIGSARKSASPSLIYPATISPTRLLGKLLV